jgi:hypothetical protein
MRHQNYTLEFKRIAFGTHCIDGRHTSLVQLHHSGGSSGLDGERIVLTSWKEGQGGEGNTPNIVTYEGYANSRAQQHACIICDIMRIPTTIRNV